MSTQPEWLPPPPTVSHILGTPGIWGAYGPPGSGKTIDQCRAFPLGLWVGDEADFRSVVKEIGWGPAKEHLCTEAHTLGSLVGLFDKFFPGNNNPKKIPSVVIDELNTIVVRTVSASTRKDGRQAYKDLNETLTRLFDRFRKLNAVGVHIAWNAHAVRPDFEEIVNPKDQSRTKGLLDREGGPEISAQAMRTVAKRSDCLYRIDVDPLLIGRPHPFVYYADHAVGNAHSGSNFFQKDRLDLVQKAPINLAEILRAAGFKIPRPPQIEAFLEPRVQWAATLDPMLAMQQFIPQVRQPGVPDTVVMWGVGDLYARLEIQKATSLSARLASRYGIFF